MTWLYIPGLSETFSPSAQASEASNSESCSPSHIGERLAEASATWRGNPQQPQAWSHRWKQGGFIRHLSGLTCSPSTLDHGVASFISSLRETHVRITAWPESASGLMALAFLPPRSVASPKSAGLILSSARTCRGMRADSSRPLSRHWSEWATALRQDYSARPKPETACGASGCLSWPSPMAGSAGTEDYNAAGNSDFSRKAMALADEMLASNWRGPSDISKRGGSQTPEKRMEGGHSVNLEDQAEHWMGPNVPNGGRSTAHAVQVGRAMVHNGKKVHMGLESQESNWTGPSASDSMRGGIITENMTGTSLAQQSRSWAGTAAQNHKGSSDGSVTRADGKSREDILSYQAEQFFPVDSLLPSSPDRPIAGGSMSSTDFPNSNRPSVKRKLNPIFVEALMRWPTGLSGFERQETAWIRWQHQQLSFLSALFSMPDEPAQQMDFFK